MVDLISAHAVDKRQLAKSKYNAWATQLMCPACRARRPIEFVDGKAKPCPCQQPQGGVS